VGGRERKKETNLGPWRSTSPASSHSHSLQQDSHFLLLLQPNYSPTSASAESSPTKDSASRRDEHGWDTKGTEADAAVAVEAAAAELRTRKRRTEEVDEEG